MRLNAVEARVVGSLIEKQLTTPQQYPLSLNALVLACNQTSNRDPVVDFDEAAVEAALNSLKQQGLVRFVLPSHGRSVVRYRHVLDEKLALDSRQLSLVAVLLLRGPQTVGELRARTERMAPFDGIDAVESDLIGLTRWQEPIVARLERRPGQKEERWSQLLAEESAELTPTAARSAEVPAAPASPEPLEGPGPAADRGAPPAAETTTPDSGTAARDGQIAALHEELAALRGDVESLREEVFALRLEVEELRTRP